VRPDLPQLFQALADLPTEQRAQYLADHAVDAETRRELEELLAHDSGTVEPFSHLVGAAARAVLHGDAAGLRCGAFRLVSVLGTGGMGVVYLAQRADGEVAQRAAIKLMQPGWSQIQLERFLREREILAALTHPNIAHLLDAGHLNDGQPYLAMEYVEGKRIDEYCSGLKPSQKIELFLKVCGAVEYLHSNYVLHRDLKPSNILVTASGEPKLLDFGIAKIVDLQGPITVTQVRMLTPDYASPEQMNGTTVGPVSDVYSLGAVLRVLLAGKPTPDGKPSELPADLEGDIELVLETATRVDPQDRYASVADFSEDLKACLESRPVRARRRDWIYRARKFARRQPISVALGIGMLAAVAGFAVLWQQQSRSASTIPEPRPVRLTSNTTELPVEGAAISPDGKVIAYTDSLGVHFHTAERGETRLIPGTSGHVLVEWMPNGSGLKTRTLDQAGRLVTAVVSVDGSVRSTAGVAEEFTMSPDGRYRARVAGDPQRIIIEDANGAKSRDLWLPRNRTLTELQWSPDTKQMAVISYDSAAFMLETVDLVSGQATMLIPPEKKLDVGALAWTDPNRMVVAIQEEGRGVNSPGGSNLWEVRLGAAEDRRLRRLTAWTDFPIRLGSLTTDGKRFAFIRSFRQRDVYVGELDAGRLRMGTPRRLTLDLGDDYPTAWTPDSKAVVFTSDRTGPSAIFRQELDKQTAEQLVFGPTRQIIARTTPDGKSILFYGREGEKLGIMRAPIEGGKAELLSECRNIMGIRCSRVGPCTIALRENDAVVVFEFDPAKGVMKREIYRDTLLKFAGPDLSPDAKWLATPSGTSIVLRSFATGEIVREIPVQGATDAMNLVNIDYAVDGKGFFAGQTTPTETRQLYVDLSGKASVLWRQAGKSMVWGIESPDGRYLAMMVYTDDSNVYTIDKI
jgi:eukaryotic-like serine/threonine-protein kinase